VIVFFDTEEDYAGDACAERDARRRHAGSARVRREVRGADPAHRLRLGVHEAGRPPHRPACSGAHRTGPPQKPLPRQRSCTRAREAVAVEDDDAVRAPARRRDESRRPAVLEGDGADASTNRVARSPGSASAGIPSPLHKPRPVHEEHDIRPRARAQTDLCRAHVGRQRPFGFLTSHPRRCARSSRRPRPDVRAAPKRGVSGFVLFPSAPRRALHPRRKASVAAASRRRTPASVRLGDPKNRAGRFHRPRLGSELTQVQCRSREP
jgi:hypothetical protein